MLVDFCLPIKDEAEILENNLLILFDYLTSANYQFNWQIVVLVNGSTDNSTLILESLKKQFLNKLDYLVINQSGRGRALKTYWGQSQSDVLAFMDIDLAVSLNHINDLIEPILNNQADLVIGSRFMSSSIVERSLKRKIVSWVYVNISKIIVPHKNIDLQCGFKAISKAGFLKIKKFLLDDYWFFDTELIILAEVANLKIVEIGVNWQEKRKSAKKSKVKLFRDSCLFIKNLFIFRKRLKKIKKNNWA